MNTPTKPKDIERINKMFWSLEELVGNLYGRWLDEHGHEDINDYKKIIEKQLKKHKFTLVGMTKKPFGFTFKINKSDAVYTITQTTKQYRWLRYL
jgi:hypothetical protein